MEWLDAYVGINHFRNDFRKHLSGYNTFIQLQELFTNLRNSASLSSTWIFLF